MYVLDTNTLVYFFKGVGDVAGKLLSVAPQEIAIPAIVLFELEVGIAKSSSPQKRSRQLKNLISTVRVLPFGLEESKIAAVIRVQLEQQGNPIGPYDVLLAATALSNNGILVSHNTAEFQRVEGLRLIDWY